LLEAQLSVDEWDYLMPKVGSKQPIGWDLLPPILREKYSYEDIKKVEQLKSKRFKIWFVLTDNSLGDEWWFEDGKWWYETFR
jgi:hypothetical protein